MQEKKELSDLALAQLVEVYLEKNKETLLCLPNLHDMILQQTERPLIEIVLKKTRYNQSKAAVILGLNRNTLKKKIVALDLLRTRNKSE